MAYQCTCECHKICHTCGRPFHVNADGLTMPHINCADTLSPALTNYSEPNTPAHLINTEIERMLGGKDDGTSPSYYAGMRRARDIVSGHD